METTENELENLEDKVVILRLGEELLQKDLKIKELESQLTKSNKKLGMSKMLVTLSGIELEDAIQMYLKQQFNREVEVTVSDASVTASIELGKLLVSNTLENNSNIKQIEEEEVLEEVKPKRTRRKKVEVLDEEDTKISETIIEIEETEEVEEKTKYASLPKLNQEDQTKYTQILSLLNTNARNKNRTQLEELSANASENLQAVLNASEHYQDWLEYCLEQDSEKIITEILNSDAEDTKEPVISDEENVIDTKSTEPVDEPVDETFEQRNLRLMQEVNEEIKEEEKEQINEKVKINTQNLFNQQNSVNKTGSLFPSRKVF